MKSKNIEKVGVIGFGAIGHRVVKALQEVILPNAKCAVLDLKTDHIPQGVSGFTDVNELIEWKPDLVIECAGHGAVVNSVPALLKNGIDVVIVSIGALADDKLRVDLTRFAYEGGARINLVSGAIGGLDALRSARAAGLDSVVYAGRKHPRSWKGSPADESFDLENITEPTVIFEGTAAEASVQYPKNANVTAAVALSGVGFEQTKVKLIADPSVDKNVHEVIAKGAFGEMFVRLANNPLPDNPKTSWLAALSIEEAIGKQIEYLSF